MRPTYRGATDLFTACMTSHVEIRYLHHRMGPTACTAPEALKTDCPADAFDELLQTWLHDGGKTNSLRISDIACTLLDGLLYKQISGHAMFLVACYVLFILRQA